MTTWTVNELLFLQFKVFIEFNSAENLIVFILSIVTRTNNKVNKIELIIASKTTKLCYILLYMFLNSFTMYIQA